MGSKVTRDLKLALVAAKIIHKLTPKYSSTMTSLCEYFLIHPVLAVEKLISRERRPYHSEPRRTLATRRTRFR